MTTELVQYAGTPVLCSVVAALWVWSAGWRAGYASCENGEPLARPATIRLKPLED